ncbi:hypothetical protein [Natronorubrum thiooxidans]|uniref:Polyprenyl synthetase n=1 Tax=Natronorubrum thiooxidans TaxID=308853 RepID=A0A1N7CNR2_9EURY|nr:hypothetical protein [Natronorubrum thiooxidans]SIR65155.1 hypothetical protein SAMN05421752_101476 [Natronorubrum thiooxidans]
MTGTTSNTIRRFARSSTDGSATELPSSVRTVVDESLSPPDRSLPAALCTVAGECSDDAADHRVNPDIDRLERVLEPVGDAVRYLEGYVRLRLAMGSVGGNAGVTAEPATDWLAEPSVDRDAAILASDSLHATAYATIAETPLPDDRLLELYRLLTQGSTALAHRSFPQFDTETPVNARVSVEATLAGVAGALGVTAVGGSTETRRCLRRYSHAIMIALASQSTVGTDDTRPRATAIAVLSGQRTPRIVEPRARVKHCSSTVTNALERARTALEPLDSDAISREVDRVSAETLPPLVRLERATRLPFQDGRT